MREKKHLIAIGIVLLIIYWISYIILDTTSIYNAYKYVGILAYIQLFYILWSWKRLTNSMFDAYTLFMFALIVFSLGQAFLEPFNLVSERFSLLTKFNVDKETYFKCEYIVLLFLLFTHLGAMCSFKEMPETRRINYTSARKALKSIGWTGVICFFPFYVYHTITQLLIVAAYGYMGLYSTDNVETGGGAIFRVLGDYYVPSLIILLIYYESAKRHRFLIYGVSFATVCLPPLIIGGRTNAVIMIAMLALIYVLFNKIRFKQVLLLTVIAGVLVIGLVFIRNMRSTEGTIESIKDIENTSAESDNFPLFSVISEMGFSFYPIVKTIDIKAENGEEFLYGKSFLWSFATVIPNINFWKIHPAKKNADMSKWITEKLGFTYGIGYALIAESYANFGFFGFAFMFLYGFLILKLFRYATIRNVNYNLIKTVVALVFLWFIIRTVRNSFVDTIRYLAFYILPLYMYLTWKVSQFQKKNKLYKIYDNDTENT